MLSMLSLVAMAIGFSTPCLVKFWLFNFFLLINDFFKFLIQSLKVNKNGPNEGGGSYYV